VPAGFLGSCADLRMRETGPGPGEKRLPVLRRREALVIRSVDRGRRKFEPSGGSGDGLCGMGAAWGAAAEDGGPRKVSDPAMSVRFRMTSGADDGHA